MPETEYRDRIIEELDCMCEIDIDKDWPIKVIPKEKIKDIIWHSPDFSDCISMRMVFELPREETNFIFAYV